MLSSSFIGESADFRFGWFLDGVDFVCARTATLCSLSRNSLFRVFRADRRLESVMFVFDCVSNLSLLGVAGGVDFVLRQFSEFGESIRLRNDLEPPLTDLAKFSLALSVI